MDIRELQVRALELSDGDAHVSGVSLTGKIMFLYNLYVPEGDRGKGIGTALIFRAIEAAKTLGYTQIDLFVDPKNRIAISIYDQLGFSMVDEVHYLGLEVL